MTSCGLFFTSEATIEQLSSLDIDDTNLVNGNPIYYYTNQTGLIPANFTNAGQVFLANTNSSVIDGLMFSNTTIGMQFFYSHDNTISNCEFRYNKLDSFELWHSHDNEIIANTFSDSNGGHLWVFYGDGNHITDCMITDDPIRNPGTGIVLADCNNTFALRNDISDCYIGIMANGEYNSFSGNNLSSHVDYGLLISDSRYNTIINNTMNNNMVGLHLEWSDNNNIVNNTMNNNTDWGLHLVDSNLNTISDNVFKCNKQDCWLDEGGTGNIFVNNVCEECPDGGNGNGPGGIPGYNLVFLISVLGIITIILLRKRLKQ
jgi:parallel beta-helix repeat protein